jgi:hypothetical protein
MRAEDGWCFALSEETRTKDDPRRKESTLSSGLPEESTVVVCKAADAFPVLNRGRRTKLLSSKLSPLWREFSSVLGLTVSAPMMTGYSTERSSCTYVECVVKSWKLADFVRASAQNWTTELMMKKPRTP